MQTQLAVCGDVHASFIMHVVYRCHNGAYMYSKTSRYVSIQDGINLKLKESALGILKMQTTDKQRSEMAFRWV